MNDDLEVLKDLPKPEEGEGSQQAQNQAVETLGNLSPSEVGQQLKRLQDKAQTEEAERVLEQIQRKITENPDDTPQIILKAYQENQEQLEPLLRDLIKPETTIDENEANQEIKKLQERLRQAQDGLLRNLQAEVIRIFQTENDLSKRAELLKTRLVEIGLPDRVVEEIAQMLSEEGVTAESVNAVLSEKISQSLEATIAQTAEIEQHQAHYSELLGRAKGFGQSKDETSPQEVMRGIARVSEEFFESMNVPGLIDLFFAVERGFGTGRRGDFKGLAEQKNEDKERQTLRVLGRVLEDETGAEVFFTSFTQKAPQELFSGNLLLKELDNAFSVLEQKNPEVINQIKEKITSSVENAAITPELFGAKIEAEQINLSEDVLRYILVMAKAYLQKRVEKGQQEKKEG